MIVTRLTWVLGLAFFVFLCWLAIRGVTVLTPFLVTAVVLAVLIGGGNAMRGSSSSGARRSRSERDGGEEE